MPSRPVWQPLLSGTAAAAPLDAALVEALQSLCRARRFKTGDVVLSRHTPALSLIAVESGLVALGFRPSEGAFRASRTVEGPAWLDISSAWLHTAHLHDAVALTPVTLLELPVDGVDALMACQPTLGRAIVDGLAHEVQTLATTAHDLVHKDAEARFVSWLLRRLPPSVHATPTPVVELHERKRDIAAQLAITPETMSRLCAQLARKGLIEMHGYTVRLLDLPRLLELAGLRDVRGLADAEPAVA